MLRLGNAHKIEQAHFFVLCNTITIFAKTSMSNFTTQQEKQKEVKEKEKLGRETLGKFFYDLAKIAFTALVVGSIVSVTTEQKKLECWLLIGIGLITTFVFARIGHKIMKL